MSATEQVSFELYGERYFLQKCDLSKYYHNRWVSVQAASLERFVCTKRHSAC